MTFSSAVRSAPPVLRALFGSKDAGVAIVLLVTVMVMIVPLPALALDVLIALNLAVSIGIILISVYVQQPMEFSVFPAILLLVTLFRLSVNIALARSILLSADAGRVVATVGSLVLGGSYVVGIVIFLTLLVIQFVVITNGAGRVAEVAARFTLDAMPGKQMTIDADMGAGVITEPEARRRRRALQREADFYGAMDGASKFVRGDAIAAILIVAINIIGGFLMGVFQGGLSLLESLRSYTLVTVGAGLIIQIPALLISTAAALLVSRANSDDGFSSDLGSQLGNIQALAIASTVVLALAFLPGFPTMAFLAVGGSLSGLTFFVWRQQQAGPELPALAAAATAPSADDVSQLLSVDALELEIGYGLIPLVGEERAENLLKRITGVRRQLASELGFILPKVRVRDNLQLSPYVYRIKLRGEEVARGEVRLERFLAIGVLEEGSLVQGEATTEPTFGLPALWISEDERGRAELAGLTVVDPISVVATHFTEVARTNASALLDRQQAQELIARVKESSPAIVDGLIPEMLSLAAVQNVMRIMLSERLPIRDLPNILEVLANHAPTTRDADVLAEAVRQSMANTITNLFRHDDGRVHVFTLAPALEAQLKEAIATSERGLALNVAPALAQTILQRTSAQMESMAKAGYQPILLCSREIRLAFRRLIERTLPNLVVIAYSEIGSKAQVQAHGIVEL